MSKPVEKPTKVYMDMVPAKMWAAVKIKDGRVVEFDQRISFTEKLAEKRAIKLAAREYEQFAKTDSKPGPNYIEWDVIDITGYFEMRR